MKASGFGACMVLVLAMALNVFGQGITLDHVDGLTPDGKIPPNATLKFHLRMTNSYAEPLNLISNGFRIYSDNLTWTEIDGYMNPKYPWNRGPNPFFDFGDSPYINIFTTGSGADTIGFAALTLYSEGVPAGFDDVAFIITAGPVQGSSGTLVLDSSFWQPANYWIWAVGGSQVDCDWGGPYIFEAGDVEPITYLEQDPILLKDLDDLLTVYVENEDFAAVDLGSVRLQGNVPPAGEPSIVGDRLVVEVSAVRFLATYRPIKESVQSTYTIDYDKTDGTHVPLTGVVNIEVTEGDLTFDGVVDIDDATLLANYLWQDGPECKFVEMMDIDGSGSVDLNDMTALIELTNTGK